MKFGAAACLAWILAVGALRAADVAPRMLLLDGAIMGAELVVVGERGTILRSADQGRTWQPAKSPTGATLTGVSFAPAGSTLLGWAVGYDAMILGTTDGGRTWTKQYQGENLQDSFLDVLALDAQHVIAVGAYGLCAETKDGGKTWAQRRLGDEDSHFNRLSRGLDGTLFLAGESGTLLRSGDAGATWTKLAAPYEGSFYGVLLFDNRTLLAYGLRGNVHRSPDNGGSWEKVSTPQPLLLATAVRTRDGTITLGGAARSLLLSRDQGRTFSPHPLAPATAVAELIELPDGNLLALGEAGATLLETQPSSAAPR